MKTGGRDLNTTGLDLKSIGESDGRGRPVSFKEPPRLGNLATKEVAKDAPTAAKLRNCAVIEFDGDLYTYNSKQSLIFSMCISGR